MKVLRRKRRLAGYTVLALILSSAAAVAAGPAQARVSVIPVVSRVVASWGDNSFGELGVAEGGFARDDRGLIGGNSGPPLDPGTDPLVFHYVLPGSVSCPCSWKRSIDSP